MGEKMMNQLRILAFSLLIFYAGLLAQIQPANPAKVGLGLNLGVQKPFCDVVHTGAGLAGEVMLRYLISPRINLSISGGYGFLNDGFVTKTFETNIIAADLKINLNLMKPGRINPIFCSVSASPITSMTSSSLMPSVQMPMQASVFPMALLFTAAVSNSLSIPNWPSILLPTIASQLVTRLMVQNPATIRTAM
jgi:hypothetical protein